MHCTNSSTIGGREYFSFVPRLSPNGDNKRFHRRLSEGEPENEARSSWLSLSLASTSELSTTSHTEWVHTLQKCWGSIQYLKVQQGVSLCFALKHFCYLKLAMHFMRSKNLTNNKKQKKILRKAKRKDLGMACHTPPLNQVKKQGEMSLPSLSPIPHTQCFCGILTLYMCKY